MYGVRQIKDDLRISEPQIILLTWLECSNVVKSIYGCAGPFWYVYGVWMVRISQEAFDRMWCSGESWVYLTPSLTKDDWQISKISVSKTKTDFRPCVLLDDDDNDDVASSRIECLWTKSCSSEMSVQTVSHSFFSICLPKEAPFRRPIAEVANDTLTNHGIGRRQFGQ